MYIKRLKVNHHHISYTPLIEKNMKCFLKNSAKTDVINRDLRADHQVIADLSNFKTPKAETEGME